MNTWIKINSGVLGLLMGVYLSKQTSGIIMILTTLIIYTSFYLLLKGIEEDFNIKYRYFDKIYIILLSYYFQKEKLVFYKNVEKNRVILATNITIALCIIVYTWFKNKRIEKKEFNLINLNRWLVLILPLFVIRGKGFGIGGVYLLLTVYKFFKDRKVQISKEVVKIVISILVFVSWIYISSFINVLSDFGKDGVKNMIEVLLIFVLFLLVNIEKIRLNELVCSFIGASLFKVIPPFIGWLVKGDFSIRVVGDTHPTIFGSEMGLMAVLFFYFIVFYKKYEYLVFYILFLLAIYSSGSRGPFLIVIFLNTMMYIWINRNSKKKKLIFFIGILICMIALLNTNNRISQTINKITKESKLDDSSLERMYIYKEAWRQFLQNPVKGNGFNNYREISLNDNKEKIGKVVWQENNAYWSFHAHNNILQLLSSLGLIGLGLYIIYVTTIFKVIIKSEYFLLAFSLIGYFELNGLLDYTLYYYKTEKILFFILAMIIVFSIKNRESPE